MKAKVKLTVYKFEVTNWASGLTFEVFIKANDMDSAYNRCFIQFPYPLYRNHANNNKPPRKGSKGT
jgi:hypothetical protein